jgi:hypothetical protein
MMIYISYEKQKTKKFNAVEIKEQDSEIFCSPRPIKHCNNTEQKKNGIFSNAFTKKKPSIVYTYVGGLVTRQ